MRSALIYIWMLGLLLAACGEQPSSKGDGLVEETSEPSRRKVERDSARILVLPTPIQIPAILRNSAAPYNKSALMPTTFSQRSFFKSSVLFGHLMIDLAYVSSYGDRQSSLEYFTKCKSLGDEMGLGTQVNQRLLDRFNRNIDRPDSLGRIILEFYDNGHGYFIDNNKEGVGLLMVMGCLFEGLHLNFSEGKKHDRLLFYHILSQQKIYTQNLLYALDEYEIPAELQTEYELLNEVGQLFEQLNPPSAYTLSGSKEAIPALDPTVLRALEAACAKFRASVLI